MNMTNPVASTKHPPGYRWRRGRNWFFLGLLYAAYYLCRYNLGIVSPEIIAEYGYNKQQFGTISTARDGGYAIGQFINGLFADGLGGKQALAVGALGTIVFNFIFGFTSMANLGWMFLAFILIRFVDGYFQAFGAPGMVKINTAWFQRRERGRFAGIYGGIIVLGIFAVGALGRYLLGGFTIPLIDLTIPKQNWRSLFFIPPIIVFVMLILMWLNVKNHPEEAGYTIAHDDDHAQDIETKLPIAYVFKTIAGNALVWVNAMAYFCTGFVRRAIEAWWVLYLVEVWKADKQSVYYGTLVWTLPLSAFLGSYTAGLISDTLFKGKRAPIAAILYACETISILASLAVVLTSTPSPALGCALLTLVSFTCNSTHSIIGTAVAMDIGGRKMAGFACGVIDSFQYIGTMLAGAVLGGLLDHYGWNALFASMLPFSFLGTILMTTVWLKTKNQDIKGS